MPATTNQNRTETVQPRSVALTPELDARLRERAELEDRSASSIVRLALRAYLERESGQWPRGDVA